MTNWRIMLREFNSELVGIFILLFIGFSGCTLPMIMEMRTRLRYDDCGTAACNQSALLMNKDSPVHILSIGNIFILVIALAFGAGICGALLIAGHITGQNQMIRLGVCVQTYCV